MTSGFAKSNYETEGHNISTSSVHRFYQHEQDGVRPNAGSLLKQFKASNSFNSDPSVLSTVEGCSFCPYDDNLLVTVTGFQNSITAGYVQMWDLNEFDEDNVTLCPVSCIFFTYSPLPACQFSSDGGLVTAILNNGVNHLSVLAVDEDDELTPCNVKCDGKNLLTGRVKCCVFSQDNQKAVTVSTDSTMWTFNRTNRTEICIWRITSRLLMKNVWRGSCELLCPEFRGNVHSCVLSPNCDYVVISSSLGQSIILDCNVFKTVSPTNCICVSQDVPVGPLTCLFNPKFPCKLLFCHHNTWCCLRDLEMGLHHQGIANYIVEDQSVTANACTFSLDGDLLAVALSNAAVVLCDARTLDKVFEMKPSFSLTQASSIAITRSCQELAAGYSNGSVCIWQLPARFVLKHLCRMVIIKLIPPNKIPLLPLPRKLKTYLLYEGCSI